MAYFAVAAIAAVALLPTVLRTAQQQPNASAELSPDAPPDNKPQSIIAALGRASSGTAGSGGTGSAPAAGSGAAVAGTNQLLPPPPPPAILKPSSCGHGFGNPPRQTESVYSPPCAAAFVGDNGGATWKGVTKDEVRLAVAGTSTAKISDGRVPATMSSSQSGADRTITVLQAYLNSTYQFYGRRLQFYGVTPSGSGDPAQRAAAQTADEQDHVFGAGFYSEVACDEFTRRQLVAFCPQDPIQHYAANAPYQWSWYMDGTKMAQFTAEYVCKKLVGKPASFAGDPAIQNQPRKFGVVYYDVDNTASPAHQFEQDLKADCGVTVAVDAGYTISDAAGGAQLSQVVVKLKSQGVTTVIPFNDFTTNAVLTNNAYSAAYLPEWVTNGMGAVDRNGLARVQNANEWAHAFGFTALDVERPTVSTDCARAYRTIDTANQPDGNICTYVWPSLQQLAAGIQQAGPKLTPQTFQAGMFAIGYRYPATPTWALGGGYGPGDWTYTDNVTEIWWNPTADDPVSGDPKVGAYEYVHQAKRYTLGQLPADNLMFKDGETTTADANQES